MTNNHVSAISLSHGYPQVLEKILNYGKQRFVRGFKTIELSPFIYRTSYPLRNKLFNSTRKLNEAFSAAEFLWIMSGRNDIEMIAHYNSKLRKFSDNGMILSGAYGPSVVDQLPYVVESLSSDNGSRQAILSIWKPTPKKSKDIPCTIALHFLINELGNLDLITYMRSNDAWLGFPYDFFNFTTIQSYVAMLLNIDIGYYSHIASSMHLYDQHFENALLASKEQVITAKYIGESCAFKTDELETVLNLEREMRNGNKSAGLGIQLGEGWEEIVYSIKKFHQK